MFRYALIAALALPLPAMADEVTVFAAASLKTALDEIAQKWQEETGNIAVISYGGSSQLARQIEQGAPAEIFISAAENWMDEVEKDGLLVDGSRRDLLGNTLVVVGTGEAEPIERAALPDTLGDEKLAMAMVDSVPAGVYGKQALENLGVWEAVAPQVAQADNVRAALALVSTGEAPYGIVYATDANADEGVSVVATFEESSHDPILYPAALIKDADEAAADLLTYLGSETAVDVFTAQGFSVLAR